MMNQTAADKKFAAVISMTSRDNKTENIARALHFVEAAAKTGASWIFLPELFTYHGPYDKLPDAAEDESGPLNAQLKDLAKKFGITLFAGSVPEKSTKHGSKVYNTQYVFSPEGSIIGKYRKIHLFNLVSDSGQKLYCESDGFLSGDSVQMFSHEGWQIALATCYDLRFSGMFSKLSQSKAFDIIVAPSAFTLHTGMDHWHLLTRARAVENLCYVVASNECGQHSEKKFSYGHSVVVDPWGYVVADSGSDEGIAYACLDPDAVKKYRSRVPVYSDRVPAIDFMA